MLGENKRISDIYIIRRTINIIRTAKMKKQWYRVKTVNADSKKSNCIIYCADGHIAHGGLADRMYGIMALYALCKIENVPFYINWCAPYNLLLFLVPNEYDWSIEKASVVYDIRFSVPRCLLGGAIRLPKNAVSLSRGKQVHAYCNFKNIDFINKKYGTDFSYKELFHELFKLSPAFAKDLQNYKSQLPQQYAGVQVRVLNAFGDFSDSVDNMLSDEERKLLITFCSKKIRQINDDTEKKVLFTSDSQILIDSIKKEFDSDDILLTIPGKITHSDFAGESDTTLYETHKKTFIDLFLLSGSTHLYQIRNKHIYKSGFSILAAKISGKEIEFI